MTHHAKGQPPDPSLLTVFVALTGSMGLGVMTLRAARNAMTPVERAGAVALVLVRHGCWLVAHEMDK